MATLDRTLLSAAVIALGLTLGGFAVGNGFARARAADRYVTVKGVAEREVRANLAIWPLRIVGADNDLTAANAKVAKNIAGVREFLVRHGVDTTQVQLAEFTVHDAYANEYAPERQPTNRYIVRQTMLVRSNQPDKVLAASQQVSELAAIGVVISSGSGEMGNGRRSCSPA